MTTAINIEENCSKYEDGDDVEVEEIGPTISQKSGKLPLKKRRLKSSVWSHFEILPVGEDKKQTCKCKRCNAIYVCDSKYGTGNLCRHLKTCIRRDTRDIGQLLIS